MRAKIAVAVVAAVMTTGVVVAMASVNGVTEPGNPRAARVTTPDTSVQGLGVFRRAKRADDALDQRSHELIAQQGYGLNPGLARKAARTAGGMTYYLVPGDKVVAIVNQYGSGGVSPVELVQTGRVIGVEVCGAGLGNDGIRVNGMLPDGPTHATVRFADGSSRTVAVTDNVWALETPKRPASALPVRVEWQDAGGTARINDIPVPGDVDEGACG